MAAIRHFRAGLLMARRKYRIVAVAACLLLCILYRSSRQHTDAHQHYVTREQPGEDQPVVAREGNQGNPPDRNSFEPGLPWTAHDQSTPGNAYSGCGRDGVS